MVVGKSVSSWLTSLLDSFHSLSNWYLLRRDCTSFRDARFDHQFNSHKPRFVGDADDDDRRGWSTRNVNMKDPPKMSWKQFSFKTKTGDNQGIIFERISMLRQRCVLQTQRRIPVLEARVSRFRAEEFVFWQRLRSRRITQESCRETSCLAKKSHTWMQRRLRGLFECFNLSCQVYYRIRLCNHMLFKRQRRIVWFEEEILFFQSTNSFCQDVMTKNMSDSEKGCWDCLEETTLYYYSLTRSAGDSPLRWEVSVFFSCNACGNES